MDSKTKRQASASEHANAGEPALKALVRLLARQAARDVVVADVKNVLAANQE